MVTTKTFDPATPTGGSKLVLGFGLVNVPVAMKPLMETRRRTAGRILCTTHVQPIKTRYMCGEGTEHEHLLEQGENATGYPVPGAAEEFVILEPSALEELAEERTGRCEIERVVPFAEIDPIYLGKAYLCYPQKGAGQAFDLIAESLRRSGSALVATTVLSKQTVMIVVRWCAELGCVVSHVGEFAENVRTGDLALTTAGAHARGEVDEAMLEAAEPLLASLAGEFDPTAVEDTYTVALDEAIAQAAAGTPREAKAAPVVDAKVVDLMEALKASVVAVKAPKPAKKPKKVAA